jgi:hypothetical protein
MTPRRIAFFLVLGCTLLIQAAVLLSWDSFWQQYPQGDSFLHILWGMTVCMYCVDVLRWRIRDAILGTLIAALWWEVGEIVGNHLVDWDRMDIFFWDGVKDIALNVVGGFIAYSIAAVVTPGGRDLKHSHLRKELALVPLLILFVIPIGGTIWYTSGESPNILAAAWITGSTLTGYAVYKKRIQS